MARCNEAVSKQFPERKLARLVGFTVSTDRRFIVIKTAALVGALAIGVATTGYAQTPSPAGQGTAQQQTGNTGPNSGSADTTRPTGTTGMNSNTSATTTNGSSTMAPKATTGSGKKTDSSVK
jgi:hypothetical protein